MWGLVLLVEVLNKNQPYKLRRMSRALIGKTWDKFGGFGFSAEKFSTYKLVKEPVLKVIIEQPLILP